MKISKNLSEILKNYSSVNPSIRIEAGSVIRTKSIANNIAARATIEESFPQTFCIYDLSQFLAALSMFNDPELIFENSVYVTIGESGTNQKIRYHFAEEAVVVFPSKDINMPPTEIEFSLSEEQLQSLLKAASVLASPHIKVVGVVGEPIKLIATDADNPKCNEYDINVEVDAAIDFEVFYKTENLKIISESYDVSISTKKISEFVAREGNLKYYIAVEKNSKFGG